MVEHQERPSKVVELTDAMRTTLDERYEEFERLVADRQSADAYTFVERLVGATYMHAASAYLAGLRVARIRAAGHAQGFRVGI